jgi:hypothetical protein
LIHNEGIKALCKLVKTKEKLEKPLDLYLGRNSIKFPNPDDVVGNDDNNLEISLFISVEDKNYVETILLCLQGADPNVNKMNKPRYKTKLMEVSEINNKKGTPLHISSLRNDIKMLEFLVEHPRIDMDTPNDFNLTYFNLINQGHCTYQ